MATELGLQDAGIDQEIEGFPWEVLTLEQFLRIPEIKPSLEFIKGRIEQKMSPNLHHSRFGTKLPKRINAVSESAKLGVAFVELRCSFGGESYVPDISYFSWNRLPLGSDRRLLDRVTTPPDWSIEILSPGQTVSKLSARLNRLIAKGIRLGWLIQPGQSRVSIFRPGQPVGVVTTGDILDADPVLPGFRLAVADLFGWLNFA